MGYTAKASPKDYDVLYSIDGDEWHFLVRRYGNDEQYATELFPSVRARLIKIIIHRDNGNKNVALTGVGIHTRMGNPTAVSDWKSFSSSNPPTRVFTSGWRTPAEGWLVADLAELGPNGVAIEVSGIAASNLYLFGSNDLYSFTPVPCHEGEEGGCFVESGAYRYLKVEIRKTDEGGVLRLVFKGSKER